MERRERIRAHGSPVPPDSPQFLDDVPNDAQETAIFGTFGTVRDRAGGARWDGSGKREELEFGCGGSVE